MGTVERSGGANRVRGPLVAATLAAAALLAGCSSSNDTATAPTTAVSTTIGAPDPADADPTSTTATPGGVSGAATLGSAAGRERDGGSTARGSTETTGDVAAGGADEMAPDVTWSLTAIDYRGEDGLEITYDCPPDGELGSVWGTGTYTDDSSVCTAAVHVGLITRARGGSVVIEISPGLEAYDASTANGVTSSAYGPWGGSFTFTVR